MIRKYGSIDLEPAEARRIALAAELWPEWMPSIRGARILERSEHRILVEVSRSQGRRVFKTKLELLPNPTGYVERQVSGMARRWDLDWQFLPAPAGVGTVVSCKFDVDLGFFGIFIPRRTMQRSVDRTFEKICRGLEAQARDRHVGVAETAIGPSIGDLSRIRIVASESELEIWLDDRRYVAERHRHDAD